MYHNYSEHQFVQTINTENMDFYVKDPLSMINPNADLDAVLQSNSIGETMTLLCPKLLDYISFPRMKFRHREELTTDEKKKILREQNKQNARRARKKRRIFDSFLSSTLENLENMLHVSLQPTDVFTNSPTIPSIKTDQLVRSPNWNIERDIIYKFLRVKSGKSSSFEAIQAIISSDVTCTIPNPMYHCLQSGHELFPSVEIHGIKGIFDDIDKRNKYLDEVFGHTNWYIEAHICRFNVFFKDNTKSTELSYELSFWEGKASFLPDEKFQKKRKSPLIQMIINCSITFAADMRINNIIEQYDVQRFMYQLHRVRAMAPAHTLSSQLLELSSLSSLPHSMNTSNSTHNFLRSFIRMRFSQNPRNEYWLARCQPDVCHAVTLPACFSPTNHSSMSRHPTVYSGIQEMIQGLEDFSLGITKLLPGEDRSTWAWRAETTFPQHLDHQTSIHTGQNHPLTFQYSVVIYAVPLLHSFETGVHPSRIPIMRSEVKVEVQFSNDNRISKYIEEFDSQNSKLEAFVMAEPPQSVSTASTTPTVYSLLRSASASSSSSSQSSTSTAFTATSTDRYNKHHLAYYSSSSQEQNSDFMSGYEAALWRSNQSNQMFLPRELPSYHRTNSGPIQNPSPTMYTNPQLYDVYSPNPIISPPPYLQEYPSIPHFQQAYSGYIPGYEAKGTLAPRPDRLVSSDGQGTITLPHQLLKNQDSLCYLKQELDGPSPLASTPSLSSSSRVLSVLTYGKLPTDQQQQQQQKQHPGNHSRKRYTEFDQILESYRFQEELL